MICEFTLIDWSRALLKYAYIINEINNKTDESNCYKLQECNEPIKDIAIDSKYYGHFCCIATDSDFFMFDILMSLKF
jgi:hypothetical protein